AAFVAGLAVQIGFKEAGKHSVEFAEEWGQLLSFGVFFLVGMAAVRDWRQFSLASWLYALLSITKGCALEIPGEKECGADKFDRLIPWVAKTDDLVVRPSIRRGDPWKPSRSFLNASWYLYITASTASSSKGTYRCRPGPNTSCISFATCMDS